MGYSPERINPGDKVHRLENIVKIVSGMDAETLDTIQDMDAVVLAVAHDCFKKLTIDELGRLFGGKGRKVLIDVKALMDKQACVEAGYLYWRL